MNIAELRRDSQSTDLSPIFERLQTLCTGSTYNLPQCRLKCFNDSINACLSTLQLSSGPFDEVNFSNSCDFMVLAMQLTGLIPVNVEGRGDCFYLAFWYGFAGELPSFEQRLEMRRMVAQIFLSKCESDPELLPLLKSEESFAVFRDLGDAEFIEAVFRKFGNFARDDYPTDISDFAISYLSEAFGVTICVWRIEKSRRLFKTCIGGVPNSPAVHVLYNGRDHYFAFRDESATPSSIPLDCEFIACIQICFLCHALDLF